MKQSVVLFVFVALCAFDASAQTYGLDNTDPSVFSKFRIPETDLRSLWANTAVNFDTYKSSSLATIGPNNNYMTTFVNSSLSPQYYLLKESDDRYLSFTADVDGIYRYSSTQSEGPGVAVNNFNKISSDALGLSATETYRDYMTGSNLFYSIGSNLQADFSDEYNDSRTSDSTRQTLYEGTKSQTYGFSLGIGWGKMRDVTSVVSAIRFQERLKQLNLLNSDLSEPVIEDLAQEFYRQGYYSRVHVRPDKSFWQDVEKTLSGDAVSLNGLNQYADSYLREIPNELRFSRNEGIVFGINLQMSYSNNYYSAYYAGIAGPSITEQLMTLGSVYVNFSHQMDLNSQVNFNFMLNGGPNLIKHPQVKQQYEMRAGAAYNYELTDRIVVSASDAFDVIFQNVGDQGKNLTNSITIEMNYFVEDNISLNSSYNLYYSDQKAVVNMLSHTLTAENSVSVGFTYYVDRGILFR